MTGAAGAVGRPTRSHGPVVSPGPTATAGCAGRSACQNASVAGTVRAGRSSRARTARRYSTRETARSRTASGVSGPVSMSSDGSRPWPTRPRYIRLAGGYQPNVILVGTSGWQYKDWRERFYPAGTPQARWLEFYAEKFATVEVNNAFYRLPSRDTFVAWRNRTPDDFCVGVKMSRYLTHIKRLKEPSEPVKRFLDHASGLGDRLGPVLLQLPPSLRFDLGALDDVLARFPASVKVAVEPRHASWWG